MAAVPLFLYKRTKKLRFILYPDDTGEEFVPDCVGIVIEAQLVQDGLEATAGRKSRHGAPVG